MRTKWFRSGAGDSVTAGSYGVLLLLLLVGEGIASDQLPRYKLLPGQELVYRGGSEFEYENGKLVHNDSWRIWVVRENADGSWRLVLRHGTSYSQEPKGEKAEGALARLKKLAEKLGSGESENKDKAPERVTFAWCDLYPDGRITDNSTLGFRMQPSRILPRLPASVSELDKGWDATDKRMDEVTHYRRLSHEGDRASLEVVRESGMNAIYGIENKDVLTFDAGRGLNEKIASATKQTYGFYGEGTGTTELVEVLTHPPEWNRRFADETEKYFSLQDAYEKTVSRKDLTSDELKAGLEHAADDLQQLAKSLETEELKNLIDEQSKQREQMTQYILDEAKERLAQLGNPSDEWSTTDLAGNTHALKDYRGKVVILDFWYRGCGWCIRAMPQVKEVAVHYEGRPVVVFGMNTDRKDEDAQFVVDKMGLTYPNLKATGLPEKYRVKGFPTLVILDQEGIIRDFHVGYSPTLKEEVIKSVDRLLKTTP